MVMGEFLPLLSCIHCRTSYRERDLSSIATAGILTFPTGMLASGLVFCFVRELKKQIILNF